MNNDSSFISQHILGDCFDVLHKLPDNSIDLVLTDPPYEISQISDGMPGGCWGKPGDKGYMKRPELDFGEWDKVPLDLNSLFQQLYRVVKPSGTVICFYDVWKISSLKDASSMSDNHKLFSQHRLCIWQKTNPVPLNSKLNYLTNSREYFVTMVKGSKPTFHSEYDTGVYEFPILHGKERIGNHPTQKPLELFKQLINKHSNAGDIVLDPFAGTATTAIASLQTGRKFVTVEKLQDYYDTGCNRISKLINHKLVNIYPPVVFTSC